MLFQKDDLTHDQVFGHLVDDVFTAHEAAEYLEVSIATFRRHVQSPNHVLPTSRTARFSSPLGVYDFQKRSSLIHVSAAGAQTLGEIASALAYGEGLQAHGRSAEFRMGR